MKASNKTVLAALEKHMSAKAKPVGKASRSSASSVCACPATSLCSTVRSGERRLQQLVRSLGPPWLTATYCSERCPYTP